MKKIVLILTVCIFCLLSFASCQDRTPSQTSEHVHTWDNGEIATEATCSTCGQKVFICTVCGEKKFESIATVRHTPDADGVCTKCGEDDLLVMTEEESAKASSVKYISNWYVTHNEEASRYEFNFRFLDKEENPIAAPMIVEIRIVDDYDETLYTSKEYIKTDDYKGDQLSATIYIPESKMLLGKNSSGKLYYKAYNKGYIYFDEYSLYVSLPVYRIKYSHNANIAKYESSGALSDVANIKITSLSVDPHYSKQINFSADIERLYQRRTGSLYIYMTLYDKEGYAIGTTSISVTEAKTRTNDFFFTDITLTEGEEYTIKISDELVDTSVVDLSTRLEKYLILTGMYGGNMCMSVGYKKTNPVGVKQYKFYVELYNTAGSYYATATYTIDNDDRENLSRLLNFGIGNYHGYTAKIVMVMFILEDGSKECATTDYSRKMSSGTSFTNINKDDVVMFDKT